MRKPKSYCLVVPMLDKDDPLKVYHDNVYGYRVDDDNKLFERLVLELNQAGLSWKTVLNKLDNYQIAFEGFDVSKVANYTEKDVQRLLKDKGIIRNPMKIHAAIQNAKVIIELQSEFGSFKSWLDYYHPKTEKDWADIFHHTFLFTGPAISRAFLVSTGYLKGAHLPSCPCYNKVLKSNPPWYEVSKKETKHREPVKRTGRKTTRRIKNK